MPLFGHKNKHTAATNTHGATDATTAPVGTGVGNHNQHTAGTGTGMGMNADPYRNNAVNTTGAGTGTGNGTGAVPETGHRHGGVTGTGILGQGQNNGQRINHQGQPGFDNNTNHANDGYNTGHYNNDVNANHGGIPPSGTLNNSDQSRGGSGQGFTGKVERTVGSLVGSSALRAKGLQKEQEANSIKVQGSELAEAERLEREAMMRRERAVGHGAHPDNKHLGAGFSSGGGPGGAGY